MKFAITVVIVPAALTLRMREFWVSAINRSPAASTATPEGEYSVALVAGPLSPLKLAPPVPATVVILCVIASTRLMRLLAESGINMSPELSKATA